MRRKRITEFQPDTRRSGVSASVMHTNRSVQTPVSFVMSLSGLALRFPVKIAQTSHPAGPRPARKTAGFRTQRVVLFDGTSEVLLEIDTGIEAGHLIAVPVEHQRLSPEELTDPTLRGLGPPRVV